MFLINIQQTFDSDVVARFVVAVVALPRDTGERKPGSVLVQHETVIDLTEWREIDDAVVNVAGHVDVVHCAMAVESLWQLAYTAFDLHTVHRVLTVFGFLRELICAGALCHTVVEPGKIQLTT